MPMPIQVTVRSRRPVATAISPCQTGCVATSAIDVATVVNRTLGIQVAKCAASATPASAQNTALRRPIAANSARRRISEYGPRTASDSPLRQNATASAGAAAAYAINGAEVEMATTATVSATVAAGSGAGRCDTDESSVSIGWIGAGRRCARPVHASPSATCPRG
jgi:hypothetical protein